MYSYSILIGLCLIGGVFAGIEVDKHELFAEDDVNEMEPSDTLEYLISLSEGYESRKDFRAKEEIDRLIAVSEVSEEKCNQEYLNQVDEMMAKYPSSVNLIPYLKYNKDKLITDCAAKFAVTGLGETPEETAAREEEEAKRLQAENERLERTIKEKSAQQAQSDEDWIKRYESVFYNGIESSDIGQVIDTLYSLYHARTATSESDQIKELSKNIFELIKLNTKLAICNDMSFNEYENLLKKYTGKFSRTIVDYISYHRLKLWQGCKRRFLNGQNECEACNLKFNDEVEAFSLVDHVLACSIDAKDPWLIKDLASIESGVMNYVHEKLGKKAHKEEKIDNLFADIIRPTCMSIAQRFRTIDQMSEVIRYRPEFRDDLDGYSIKWLRAIAICSVMNDHPREIQEKVFSDLNDQHQEAKKNTCLGKLFHKNS